MKLFTLADGPHINRVEFLKEEIKRASKAFQALKDRAKTLRLAISRRQRDSQASGGDLDRSGNMTIVRLEATSGTTLDANQASGLETTGKLADDAKATLNLGSDLDSDSDWELIELDMCVYPNLVYFVSTPDIQKTPGDSEQWPRLNCSMRVWTIYFQSDFFFLGVCASDLITAFM